MTKYIIRLDDACPTMHWKKWDFILQILDKYEIKPIIAIIPNNQDTQLMIDACNKNFWREVKRWVDKGYHIGMHGYDHVAISNDSGIVPLNKKSEFAGVDVDIQRRKIRAGWKKFNENGLKPKIWIAPFHTFDKNTLKILQEETEISMISDTIAYYPYSKDGFFWLPQQLWWYSEKREGIWTICLHPNNMDENRLKAFESILIKHNEKFIIDINELSQLYENRRKSFYDEIYSRSFFLKRMIQQSQIYKYLRGYR